MKQENRAPPRATHSQRYGAAFVPNTEKTVVKRIGNGFQDGPPVVTRSRCVISRPQRIQAQGSYVGVEGRSRVSADSARQTPIAGHTGRVRRAPDAPKAAGPPSPLPEKLGRSRRRGSLSWATEARTRLSGATPCWPGGAQPRAAATSRRSARPARSGRQR